MASAFTRAQLQAKKEALSRAKRVKTRWVRAARDGGTKIQDGEKALLVRMIALEILRAQGETAFGLSDLP